MFNEETTSPNEENIRPSKILLADDDAAIRRLLEVVLRRAGYEVVAAEDGLAAMQIALTENFDAVVADAVMPNMTGFDLCRFLRQNPNYEKTPLIILSGMETDAADCIADRYLMKNADLKENILTELKNLF